MERRSVDFEISFFEKLVKGKDDFVDALIPLAEAYTRKGLYEKGLEIDLRLVQLMADDPIVHYNLGCSLCLIGRKEEALKILIRAVLLGYDDPEHMREDPDLATLREEPVFKKLLLQISQEIEGT